MNIWKGATVAVWLLASAVVVSSRQAPADAPKPDDQSSKILDLATRLTAAEQELLKLKQNPPVSAADDLARIQRSYAGAFEQAKSQAYGGCHKIHGTLAILVDNSGKVSVSCSVR